MLVYLIRRDHPNTDQMDFNGSEDIGDVLIYNISSRTLPQLDRPLRRPVELD